MPARLTPATRAFFTNVAAEGSFGMKFAFANIGMLEPVVVRALLGNPQTASTVRTTTAVTMASGSPKENVLPIRATAVVNFRWATLSEGPSHPVPAYRAGSAAALSLHTIAAQPI